MQDYIYQSNYLGDTVAVDYCMYMANSKVQLLGNYWISEDCSTNLQEGSKRSYYLKLIVTLFALCRNF